jgi:sodium-dependent phosphate cotransporter
VFTSTITPLVGLGVISVDRMYPLTLGSNIGTTTTAMLASLSAEPNMLRSSLQIALCHLAFNLHGILLFYPIPAMRLPLNMCKVLGRTTATYRWFAIVYLVTMFCLVPGLVLSLSIAGSVYLVSVMVPIMILSTAIIIINVLQERKPSVLPALLKTWNWLPEWMHSLEPADRLINSYCCCFGSRYTAIASRQESPDPDQVIGQV